jgi:hypothetical protein
MDAAHGAACLAAAALTVVTFASEVVSAAQIQPLGLHVLWRWPSHGRRRPRGWRLGRPMDLGTHGGVCGLATEGRHPVDLGTKLADRSTPCRIYGMQHTDPVTQVDGLVMMDRRWNAAASGHGR